MSSTLTHPDLSADELVSALVGWDVTIDAGTRRTRTVLDTFDGRLHAAGMRLEWRDQPQPSLVLGTSAPASETHLPWAAPVSWPAQLPRGLFRSRIESVTRERALVPFVTMSSIWRPGRLLDERGTPTVTFELHEQVRFDPDGEEPRERRPVDAWFLEVRAISGHDDAAELVITRLRRLGCTLVAGDAITAVADATGRSLAGHDTSPAVPLDPREDALTAIRRVLVHLLDTIVANLDGTARDIDPEFLHELRVAVRRTRTVLAQSKGVLPPGVRAHYRERFGWLGQLTGPPRDLDVQVMGWTETLGLLASVEPGTLDIVLEELEGRQREAHRDLATALRGSLVTEMLDEWRRWLTADDDGGGDGGASERLGPFVAKRVRQAQDRVIEQGRSITASSPAEQLHDLRKDAKQLRYLLECFATLFDPVARKRFVGQLKALQDNLGDHQDAEVQAAQLRALAEELDGQPGVERDVLLALGQLTRQLERRWRRARKEFAVRFAAYDTKANRRALAKLLEPAAAS